MTDFGRRDILQWCANPIASGFDLDLDLSSLAGFGFDLDLRGWWICTTLIYSLRKGTTKPPQGFLNTPTTIASLNFETVILLRHDVN